MKTRIADCKRDDTKGRGRAIFRGSRFAVLPEKIVGKLSSKAKRLCETEIKKDSFDARSSIVKINVVTVEYPAIRAGSEEGRLFSQAKYPPSQKKTKKIMQGKPKKWT